MPFSLSIHVAIPRFALILLVGLLLGACRPSLTDSTDHLHTITTLDQQQLPAGRWALSESVIQLGFCRDRINAALLAEEDELRRWRLIGDNSAFPKHRQEGLEQLAYFYQQYQVRLYQLHGNFGAQWFRVAYLSHEPEPNIFDIFAKLGRDEHVCFSSLEHR
ncbi:hypothetical protein SAMN02927930_00868 [Pseudidiomarina indica]|uniref:Uncharacterized protein n=1 Tax=Pseudidiomarina indica TaxID=1159017 RepID=A0A1G6BL71_9GAMM|nr:hypothetical protein [Pseudidiomarina indica]SDB21341.1 hypothetical protein SAMN02927930_00868 [Pseudidiomarina indica]